MTTKLYTHAGVSRLNGAIKVRFANDSLRVKVLAKGGHTDIDIRELGRPMTKADAVQRLLDLKFGDGNAEITVALAAELDKRSDIVPVAKEITLSSIMAKKVRAQTPVAMDQVEDAPI